MRVTYKYLFLFVVIFLICCKGYGQVTSGVLVDKKTMAPVSFAHVYTSSGNHGTMSDSIGKYTLSLNGLESNDSIRIQRIGYEDIAIQYSKSGKYSDTIKMTALVTDLADIEVTSTTLEEEVELGFPRTKSKKFVSGWSGVQHRGLSSYFSLSEIGTVIKLKKNTDHLLKSVSINLAANTFDSVLLRINFHKLENNLPVALLHDHEIMAIAVNGKDRVTVNLADYHILVKENFGVSLEWLDAWESPSKRNKNANLLISAHPFGGQTIVRHRPDEPWLTSKKWKLGISVISNN